ncbi:MAG TPA: energy-coupling factor ABC transporter permease [Arachnia sp.]|nr:energy-coupling factor ABC transporter permease [Arachnia sp.]HMT87078.1 energy-coupling factor ABC transporter permease [Arachnia sp.]
MHVPDHFLDPATSVATVVAAGAALGIAGARLRRTPSSPSPALVAATTAAVFGLQMLNFPVADGTSGHLLGGALAAAVLGPWWGMISVTLVLLVQAVGFADGGLTALGTNVLLMAVVGVLVGWATSRAVLALVRRQAVDRRPGAGLIGLAAGVGGAVSVVAASAVFTVLFALGGTAEVPLGALAGAMLGVHALIGVGEALITGVVVAAVALVAPGAMALAQVGAPAPESRVPGARTAGVRAAGVRAADVRAAGVPAAGARAAGVLGVVAVVAAGVLSALASGLPDGLEATALSLGFADAAGEHWLAAWPLAGYGDATGLFVGLAGLAGVALCGVAALGTSRALSSPRPVDA